MVLYILSLIGVVVFSISGALEAGRKEFDLMGVGVIAVVTAIGGGTIRDLLLDNHPLFWIKDTNYLWAAILASAFTFLYFRRKKAPRNFLLIADSLGLALFTIGGTELAEAHNVSGIIAVLMGMLTGSAGGILRDVLCREVPILFRPDETLYATAAILGSSSYLLLEFLDIDRTVAALVGMFIVALLRLLAIFYKIKLPKFRTIEI